MKSGTNSTSNRVDLVRLVEEFDVNSKLPIRLVDEAGKESEDKLAAAAPSVRPVRLESVETTPPQPHLAGCTISGIVRRVQNLIVPRKHARWPLNKRKVVSLLEEDEVGVNVDVVALGGHAEALDAVVAEGDNLFVERPALVKRRRHRLAGGVMPTDDEEGPLSEYDVLLISEETTVTVLRPQRDVGQASEALESKKKGKGKNYTTTKKKTEERQRNSSSRGSLPALSVPDRPARSSAESDKPSRTSPDELAAASGRLTEATPVTTTASPKLPTERAAAATTSATPKPTASAAVVATASSPITSTPVRSSPKRTSAEEALSPQKGSPDDQRKAVPGKGSGAQPRQPQNGIDKDKLIYSKINECTSTERGVKYNLWAVITNVKRPPGPTRGRRLMAQVYIQDQDCKGTYDRPDYQFSLLGEEHEHFPPLSVGAVLRVHHMVVQQWNGDLNGRVYDARSVVVIPGGVNDDIVPKYTSNPETFQFTATDEAYVRELRLWWSRRNFSPDVGMSKHEKTFAEVKGPVVFDVYCLVKKRLRDIDTGDGILRVSDGTQCDLSLISYDENRAAEGGTQLLCADPGNVVVDIFFKGCTHLFSRIKEDSSILLRGVHCEKTIANAGNVHVVLYKLVVAEPQKASFEEVPLSHPRMQQAVGRLIAVGSCNSQSEEVCDEILHEGHLDESAPPNPNANSRDLSNFALPGLDSDSDQENIEDLERCTTSTPKTAQGEDATRTSRRLSSRRAPYFEKDPLTDLGRVSARPLTVVALTSYTAADEDNSISSEAVKSVLAGEVKKKISPRALAIQRSQSSSLSGEEQLKDNDKTIDVKFYSANTDYFSGGNTQESTTVRGPATNTRSRKRTNDDSNISRTSKKR